MSRISYEEFEQEDPRNKGYSLVEFDLAARLGRLHIRKNLNNYKFEIYDREKGEVRYSGTLPEIVRIANELEGSLGGGIEIVLNDFRRQDLVNYTHNSESN